MPLEDELSAIKPKGNTLLTVGVFDGVHLGHQKLLSSLVKKAKERELASGVVTFRNHPSGYFENKQPPLKIISAECKDNLIKANNVDFVLYLNFSQQLAQTNSRQFCHLLMRYRNMKGMVLGFDFAMGHNREGDVTTIRSIGQELGFSVELVAPVFASGEIVSSSAIREAIASGNIIRANKLLGRYFSVEGTIVEGTGTGTKLGFPTANINIAPEFALPPDGVYATIARIDKAEYLSATNIGSRPTFGPGKRQIEVHVLGFTGKLYGKKVKIRMVERIRDELKFNSQHDLKEQIIKDIDTIRLILERTELFS